VRRHRPLIEQVEALDRDRCRAQRRAAPSKSPESLIRGGSKDVPEQRCKALVPLPSRPPLESPASAATNNEKAVGIERRGGGASKGPIAGRSPDGGRRECCRGWEKSELGRCGNRSTEGPTSPRPGPGCPVVWRRVRDDAATMPRRWRHSREPRNGGNGCRAVEMAATAEVGLRRYGARKFAAKGEVLLVPGEARVPAPSVPP
jgi:hypothetical protein